MKIDNSADLSRLSCNHWIRHGSPEKKDLQPADMRQAPQVPAAWPGKAILRTHDLGKESVWRTLVMSLQNHMLVASQSSRSHHTLAVRKLAESIFAPKSSTFHGFRDFEGHSWAFQVSEWLLSYPFEALQVLGLSLQLSTDGAMRAQAPVPLGPVPPKLTA